jgi:hypothetical protein
MGAWCSWARVNGDEVDDSQWTQAVGTDGDDAVVV